MGGSGGHVMVVGGTGMLAGVCRALAGRGHAVSVLSRRRAKLGAGVAWFGCDYTDGSAFEVALRAAVARFGAPEVLVTWIHGTAPGAAEVAARVTGARRHVRVVGSAGAREPGEELGGEVVVLGYRVEGGVSRWLTDGEICAGVLGAIDRAADRTVVGVVEPWEGRPG